MFFACFWLEGFRTSIDHRVDTMFLKKTFKKISKPQMLAICFWLIQIKNSYQNHMKINRYAFTFPNWVWLLSMEIQEIQTSSQGTSSLFLSAKKLSCCFFLRAQTRKSHSSKVLQENAVEKGCKMKPFKQNQKNDKFKKLTFSTWHPSTLEETDLLRIFWVEISIPVLPCIDSGEVGLGNVRSSFPHVSPALGPVTPSGITYITHLDAMVFL